MIRFVDIGDQIMEGEKRFAFYDTVRDEFFGWPNSYVWNSWDDFVEYYKLYEKETEEMIFPLSRFRALVPQGKGWGE